MSIQRFSNHFIYISALVLFFSYSHQSKAGLAEEALIKSCELYLAADDIDEDTICFEYINGFIDGAVITDTAIVENFEKQSKQQGSDFFQRAYKTRLGKRGKPQPATFYANFCLPDDVSRHEIVRRLVKGLNKEQLNNSPFNQALYENM